MAKLTREDMKLRYEIFDAFALNDQRYYYKKTVERHQVALQQVNYIRALLSLITGLAAALSAVLAQAYYVGEEATCTLGGGCIYTEVVVMGCIVVSVALPAIGGFFNSLLDLYQWDRLISIYESALENITVADSLSPDEDQPGEDYALSYYDYIEGTLQVMSDETSQWGQSIRTPRSTEAYIEDARRRANELGGDADAAREEANKPPPG